MLKIGSNSIRNVDTLIVLVSKSVIITSSPPHFVGIMVQHSQIFDWSSFSGPSHPSLCCVVCGIVIAAVFNLKPVFWFIGSLVLGYDICERDRQTARRTDREIETEREGGRHRERERESLCVTSEESAFFLFLFFFSS